MSAELDCTLVGEWSRQHSLAWVLHQQGSYSEVEAMPEEAALVDPHFLQSQLYVPSGSPSWEIPSGYAGVVFPPKEFLKIARSPQDLARHADVRTRGARAEQSNKAEVVDTARRAAVHALIGKDRAVEALDRNLAEQLLALRALRTEVGLELRYPNLRCLSAADLLGCAVVAESAIHDVICVAAERQKWDDEKQATARVVLDSKLYTGSNFTQLRSWWEYIHVAGHYVKVRRSAIVEARKVTQEALRPYKEYERSKQQQAA